MGNEIVILPSALYDSRGLTYLEFNAAGMPQTKGSWRPMGRTKNGRIKLLPDNESEAGWATTVAWAARAALGRAPAPSRETRWEALLEFSLLAPPSGRRTNRRDLDKLARSVLDALAAIVWADDEQVDRLLLHKLVNERPGLHAELTAL